MQFVDLLLTYDIIILLSKQKATITIIVTSEEGQQVKRKLLGTNKEIAFILGEFGILCKEECKILKVKEN